MEDADFSFGSNKKKSAKTGRRAKREEELEGDAIGEDTLDVEPPQPARDPDAPPRPSRRTGGWGEEKRKTMEELDDLDKAIENGEQMVTALESRRNRGGTEVKPAFGFDSDEEDGDRFKQDDDKQESDDEPDIPIIPDLEDEPEMESTIQIAMAPNIVVNRVATFRELDNDLLRHAQFLTLDNEIDLKLLAKGLSAEADVQDEDKPWDWDRLFTEVTSELLTEWESNAEKEEETAAA